MIASGFIFPWETVLDAACAEGYGSKYIAMRAHKVIGYEIDEGCIARANANKPENTEFKVMDLDTCELPDVDALVSLETIEHLNDMKHFFEQVKKHVRRVVIISTPLGGTSFAYKNEPPSPGTEKNDFGSHQDVEKLIEDDDWHNLTYFQYGYSHFGVYFKGDIIVPNDYKKFIHHG